MTRLTVHSSTIVTLRNLFTDDPILVINSQIKSYHEFQE